MSTAKDNFSLVQSYPRIEDQLNVTWMLLECRYSLRAQKEELFHVEE